MAIENFTEVQEYLTTNKENADIKGYLDSFKVDPTLEVFKSKLNDADFKSFMDSERDKHSTKSLETWKTNNLQKIVDEKVKELYPQADPKDVELNKLRIEIEKMQREGTRKEQKNKALILSQEKKLPVDLVDFFVGLDEEQTTKNIEALEKVFSTHIEAAVAERLKGSSYTPPKAGENTTFTTEQIAKMSPDEINKNWGVISKSMQR